MNSKQLAFQTWYNDLNDEQKIGVTKLAAEWSQSKDEQETVSEFKKYTDIDVSGRNVLSDSSAKKTSFLGNLGLNAPYLQAALQQTTGEIVRNNGFTDLSPTLQAEYMTQMSEYYTVTAKMIENESVVAGEKTSNRNIDLNIDELDTYNGEKVDLDALSNRNNSAKIVDEQQMIPNADGTGFAATHSAQTEGTGKDAITSKREGLLDVYNDDTNDTKNDLSADME